MRFLQTDPRFLNSFYEELFILLLNSMYYLPQVTLDKFLPSPETVWVEPGQRG